MMKNPNKGAHPTRGPRAAASPQSAARRAAGRACASAALALAAGGVSAAPTASLAPPLEVGATLELGFGGFGNWGTNFGRGRFHPRSGAPEGDPTYGEAYVEPALDFRRDLGRYGELYGQVSSVASVTLGDGDPAGFSSGGDGSLGLEAANLGWRSGSPGQTDEFPVFDVAVGPQEFDVGDGFLIDDGNFDAGDDGATWLLPRQAFRRAFVGRMDYRQMHLDAFFLEADRDQENTAIAGSNLEYRIGEGHLGFLFFQVVDSDVPSLYPARLGMETYSARINDLRLPSFPDLAFHGEYARQTGSGADGDFDATAWYGEVGYTFSSLAWSPTLSYRYAFFSGDADPGDGTRRDFEPFFYGFDKRGWGTWFQGEVGGGWYLYNSNQRNHYAHLRAEPREDLAFGAIGLRYELAESNYLGTPVTRRHFGDEFNAYADWSVSGWLVLSLAYGVLVPGRAAIDALGSDDAFHTLEGAMYLSF